MHFLTRVAVATLYLDRLDSLECFVIVRKWVKLHNALP